MPKDWRYLEDAGVSAQFGLAADEYLMHYYAHGSELRPPVLRLYTYRSHCALVGRFQNIEAELDLEACRELGVQFCRRPTGGGAILMGAEQLGLCFVAPADFDAQAIKPIEVYRKLAAPVLQALSELGIATRFRPRNDLEAGGRKIAGLGIYYDANGAMLFHTSLLVGLDISMMLKVLKVPVEKIADKVHTQSVADRITTISSELNRTVTVTEVQKLVKEHYATTFGARFVSEPWTVAETAAIEKLAEEKYTSESWIFQRTPQPDMIGTSIIKTKAGLLRTYISLKGQVIKSVLVTGDFFDHSNVLHQLEARLKWGAFDRTKIQQAVRKTMSAEQQCQLAIPEADLVEAICKAGMNARAKNRLTNKGSCYYPLSKTPADI